MVERVQPWTTAPGIAEHEGPGMERATMAAGLRPRSRPPEAAAREVTWTPFGGSATATSHARRQRAVWSTPTRQGGGGGVASRCGAPWRAGGGAPFMDLDPLRAESGCPRVGAASGLRSGLAISRTIRSTTRAGAVARAPRSMMPPHLRGLVYGAAVAHVRFGVQSTAVPACVSRLFGCGSELVDPPAP